MNAERIELAQLRVLVALAEERTFTGAGLRLGMSQPAVSRALSRFESVVEVQLVRRTTRSLSLTEAGKACYDAALVVLRGVDGVVAAARGRAVPLRLGYSWAAFGQHTSDVLRAWRELHPEVVLEVHRVDDRSAGLANGAVDVAISRDVVTDPAMHVEAVFSEGRMAAVPRDSALADRASLTLADLVAEVVVLVPPLGTTTLELWPAGARPTRVIEVTNTDEWLMAIATAQAVGVTPESTPTQHPHPGVRFVPLPDAPRLTVNLVWPKEGKHPALDDFVEVVHDCIGR